MRYLMSINYKFFGFNPLELIDIVKTNSSSINGFEVAIDYNNEEEIKYLFDLAFLASKNDMYIQIHGSNCSIDEQIKFLNRINSLSDVLGYKINVVVHPLCLDTIQESIDESSLYFSNLFDLIKDLNVTISTENLNDSEGMDRLSKTDLIPVLSNNNDLFFTYDMGHEIADYGNVCDLNPIHIERLNNVHIHVFDYNGDHLPILKNSKNKEYVIKSITYLKLIKYNGSIVFEYNLYEAMGDDLTSKLISYIDSMNYVIEHF